MSSAREINKSETQPWKQGAYNRGMVKNAPAEDIPDGAVALLRNAHAFPTEVVPRLAAIVYSTIQPPVLLDDNGDQRSSITAMKDGDRIVSLSGNIFTDGDVTNYFVWPGDPAFHDEIQEYISATEVRVDTSGDRESTSACWIHARLNLNTFHKSERKKLYQWGTDVYVADNIRVTSWTKVLCISYDRPSNVISQLGYDDMDEYSIIGNSNGTFQVDFSPEIPIMWKKNTNVPSVLVTTIPRTDLSKYRFDYTYSMTRLNGTGIRDRTTEGALIVQESGTVALNPNEDPARDYGTRWTTRRIDSGIRTQGRLVAPNMAAANVTPTYWFGLTGAASGVVRITINEETENFIIDFGPTGWATTSMKQVATAIQSVVRTSFPFFTCDYYNPGYFVITSGEEDGSELGWGLAGTGVGYTDISAIMLIRNGDGGTLDNKYSYAQPQTMGTLSVPRVASVPELPERHWTHYSVYRTTDIGPLGVTPRVMIDSETELPPLKFTWVKDVRIGGAFYASRTADGIVTAGIGTFEEDDVGTGLEWEDSEIDTIVEYINSTQVRVTGSGDTAEHYYGEPKSLQACAIGGGDVMRMSQTGNTVTRTNGDVFTEEDVGNTITWSTGYYSIIIEYIDGNTVIVNDFIDKDVQGGTLDPLDRIFNDTVSDTTLRARQGELYIGLLTHRFYVAMPNINILAIVPGFMITAVSGGSLIYYCQLSVNKKYLSGYHIENRQILDKVEDSITLIKKIPNKFIVFCNNSVWGGPTNVPDIKQLPEFGEAFAILHADIIDADLGLIDVGSIREVDYGVYHMRTSEGSVRQFDAYGFSKEIGDLTVDSQTGQDIVKKDMRECWNIGASCYMDNIGYIWWGRVQ